ncbi:MAG TPA: hypothetical protein VFN05_11295, partial [Actinomycetes bacterium]|nr:hypothetical protein [Actinomycetes bacterium]
MNRHSRRALALTIVGILLLAGTIAGGVWLGLRGDRQPAVTALTGPQPTTQQPTTPQPTGPQPTTQPTSPRILSVTTVPVLPRQGGFLRLPAGAGTLTIRVRAVNTTKVRFYLTPTGTEMFNENQLIGQDTNGRDGWTLAWRYQDQPLLAHLIAIAVGANGGSSPMFMLGVYHPDPAPRIVSVTTSPTLPREGGFLRLPAGAGQVVFRVQTVNSTQRMRFLLSPTGTDTSARLLGEDTNGGDGWTLAWRYPDEPLTAHL